MIKNKSNFILSKFIKKTLSTVNQTIIMVITVTNEWMLDQYNAIMSKSNAAITLAQKAINLRPWDEAVVARGNEAITLAKSAVAQAVKADLSKTSEESLLAIYKAATMSDEALIAANKAWALASFFDWPLFATIVVFCAYIGIVAGVRYYIYKNP